MVRLMGFEPTQVALPPPEDGASAVPPQPLKSHVDILHEIYYTSIS
jgi:hypothetical protein